MSQNLRCVAILAIAASAGQAWAAGGVIVPTSWNRGEAWTGDGTNPVPIGGQPVWYYEAVTDTQAGQLGSARPWYMQPRTPLGYDTDWFGTGQGAYALGDDINPPIFDSYMVHNVFVDAFTNVPVVRWQKPSYETNPAIFVQGSFRLVWDGPSAVGVPNDVDVVVALVKPASGTMTTLFSQTVSSAITQPSVGGQTIIPINLSVTMDAGDSILYSLRGRQAQSPNGSWIRMYDDNITISSIPAPGATGLLALAGFAAARRRRNR